MLPRLTHANPNQDIREIDDLLGRDEIDAARSKIERLLAKRPDDARLHFQLAWCDLEAHPEQAARSIERALHLRPDDVDAFLEAAWLMLAVDVPRGRSYGARAVELAGERRGALDVETRARLAYLRGRFSEIDGFLPDSEAYLEEAIGLAPQSEIYWEAAIDSLRHLAQRSTGSR